MESKRPEQKRDLDGPDLPDEPLDLEGFDTMKQTFGDGKNKRVVLVSKGVSLKQLIADSK
jgi:hypothetical protein